MMSDKLTVLVTDIQRFCMHDGDGVRTTVFFKGCPLRCKWCHNPETQSHRREIMLTEKKCVGCMACASVCRQNAQIFGERRLIDREKCLACGRCANVCGSGALAVSGRETRVDEIMAEVMKDAAFYGKNGGLTVSGGEPTAQIDALTALLISAKEKGITTCVETCGVFDPAFCGRLSALVDLFLYDIKDTDADRLYANTGAPLDLVTGNLRLLDEGGAATVLRCVMLPRVNMTDAHADALAKLFLSLRHARHVELLPYHPYGNAKAAQLGRIDAETYEVPESGALAAFAGRVARHGVPVKLHGTMIS